MLSNPNSDGYNPSRSISLNWKERLYLIGHSLSLSLPTAKLAGVATNTTESVWTLNQVERGLAVEEKLGGNLPKNFPVVDRFTNGVATSIKSVDLAAKTYNKGNGLLNLLKGYVNKLDGFGGALRQGINLNSGNMSAKALEIAIQPGKASLKQWIQIGQAMKYAYDNNIRFTIKFIKFSMLNCSVYRIKKKGYLIFGYGLTTTGLLIGIAPFFRVEEHKISAIEVANAIKSSLTNKNKDRLPHPKNWDEYDKEFSIKTGVKFKVLNSSTTLACNVEQRDGKLFFIPLKHAEKPDEGFVNFDNDKDVNVVLADNASDEEIFNALEIAFSRAE